jgi:hypothetical protein
MKIIKPEKEKCINCGAETPYLKNLPIDLRENYIEGAGQLCKTCFDKLYDKKKIDETI